MQLEASGPGEGTSESELRPKCIKRLRSPAWRRPDLLSPSSVATPRARDRPERSSVYLRWAAWSRLPRLDSRGAWTDRRLLRRDARPPAGRPGLTHHVTL